MFAAAMIFSTPRLQLSIYSTCKRESARPARSARASPVTRQGVQGYPRCCSGT